MQKIKSIAFVASIGVAVVGLTISSATATVILNVDATGHLTGAQNVDVNGTLYNVEFVEGTCAALFNGCDSISDFDFSTEADAVAAGFALLNQVLLNVTEGAFDADPFLTFGCATAPANCTTSIPFAPGDFFPGTDPTIFVAVGVVINVPGAGLDNSVSGISQIAFDTASLPEGSGTNYATFSQVPEPSSLLLLGFGLGGLGLMKRGRP